MSVYDSVLEINHAQDGFHQPHYVDENGNQPWDEMVEDEVAQEFAYGNIVKYLRRHKGDNEGDIQKAKNYLNKIYRFDLLIKLARRFSTEELQIIGAPSEFDEIVQHAVKAFASFIYG
jgi:Protein of unknwon function (DUF3310)